MVKIRNTKRTIIFFYMYSIKSISINVLIEMLNEGRNGSKGEEQKGKSRAKDE